MRAFVDAVYTDGRTDLPAFLSYRQLVDYLPDIFAEPSQVDGVLHNHESFEARRRLRVRSLIRFQQERLLDEVARELMILRNVLNDFLWREGRDATEGDFRELRDALCRANVFADELIAQALVVYAASLRPPLQARTSHWPPRRRRRRTGFPKR